MSPLLAVAAVTAVFAAALLFAIALLHVYWALGGFWPGHDDQSLARTVVGSLNRMPPAHMSWAVAIFMAGGALLPLIVRGWLAGILAADTHATISIAAQYLVWFLAGVFAVRGLAGFFWSALIPASRDTPFEALNRKIYSPLCLGIALLLGMTAAAGAA